MQVAKVTVPFLTITITEGGLVPKVFMEIEPYWLLVVKPAIYIYIYLFFFKYVYTINPKKNLQQYLKKQTTFLQESQDFQRH